MSTEPGPVLREDAEPDAAARAELPWLDTPFAELAQALVHAPDVVLPARAGFKPTDLSEVGFVLKPTTAERLSGATQAVLTEPRH